jgi:hypothetical protein
MKDYQKFKGPNKKFIYNSDLVTKLVESYRAGQVIMHPSN